MDLFRAESGKESMSHCEDPLGVRSAEQELDPFGIPAPVCISWFNILGIAAEPGATCFQ